MGRGRSKGGGNRGFTSVEDLENKLTGADDARADQFSNAYSEVNKYTRNLVNNMEQSIRTDGYDDFTDRVLQSERDAAQRELDGMGKYKTPEQLGTAEALKERIEAVEKLRRDGKARGNVREREEVQIVTETNAPTRKYRRKK